MAEILNKDIVDMRALGPLYTKKLDGTIELHKSIQTKKEMLENACPFPIDKSQVEISEPEHLEKTDEVLIEYLEEEELGIVNPTKFTLPKYRVMTVSQIMNLKTSD